MGNRGNIVVTCSIQNRISNHDLFCFFDDKAEAMIKLRLEEDDHLLVLKDGEKVIARWNAATATKDDIQDVAESYAESINNNLERRLCHFWKQHPRAKFSVDSIAGAVGSTRTNVTNKLELLVEKGILREQHDGQNNVIYYLNNENEETQKYIQHTDKLHINSTNILNYQLAREAVLV